MFSLRSVVVATALISSTAFASPTRRQSGGLDLSHQLKDEPTALGRFNLLNKDVNNFVFDFLTASSTPGQDGKVVLATAGTFPATIGNGVAMGVGFMGPCGLNVPHLHPRSSELLIALGGSLTFGTITENGATFVTDTINDHQATLFPAGSIHFQQNLNCTATQFVAAFGVEDPGRLDIAPALFQDLPNDIVSTTLGDIGVEEVQSIAKNIPLNVAFGVQQCLDRCKLDRAGQWTPEAVEQAKRQFEEFMKQGAVGARDFAGLPVKNVN